jgi:hypothetical protein
MKRKKLYVAETDEKGRVACVWVADHSSRGAHVFDPEKHIFDPVEPAEFSGVDRQQMLAWFATTQTGKSGQGNPGQS